MSISTVQCAPQHTEHQHCAPQHTEHRHCAPQHTEQRLVTMSDTQNQTALARGSDSITHAITGARRLPSTRESAMSMAQTGSSGEGGGVGGSCDLGPGHVAGSSAAAAGSSEAALASCDVSSPDWSVGGAVVTSAGLAASSWPRIGCRILRLALMNQLLT